MGNGGLLWRADGKVRAHDERRIGDDGAAAELAAVLVGVLDAAVIAPFAGVVHVGLALFEQLAVAGERIDALGRGHIDLDLLLDAGFAVSPLDIQPLLGEQAFVVGNEFSSPWNGAVVSKTSFFIRFSGGSLIAREIGGGAQACTGIHSRRRPRLN